MAGNREIVDAVTDELQRAGASDIEYRHEGRGHPRIWYTLAGKRRWYVIPGTTGDTLRAAKNSRADVRRVTGYVRPEKAASGPRRGKKAAPRPPAPECPAITVKPDPWQALDTLKEQMQETTSTVRTPSVVPTSSLWQRVLAWFR